MCLANWGVYSMMHTLRMLLTALRQALFQAKKKETDFTEIIHHSDHGAQHISADCTADLKELGVQVSVGLTGNSYRNALSEFMNGAYKCEMVKDRLFESVRGLESDTAGGSGGMRAGCIRVWVIGYLRRWFLAC